MVYLQYFLITSSVAVMLILILDIYELSVLTETAGPVSLVLTPHLSLPEFFTLALLL